MMTSQELSSMYAQIVNGVTTKEQSKYVTDDESGALWDTISREVAEMREANPNAVFAIPNEMPDSDDADDTDGEEGEEAAPDEEPAPEEGAPTE